MRISLTLRQFPLLTSVLIAACEEHAPSDATNRPPTVSLTTPPDGVTLGQGGTIMLGATASDEDGSITRVEFFAGTSSLAVDPAAPYQASWNPGSTGVFALTARATDDSGATSVSPVVTVTITAGGGTDAEAPTIDLTSPANGAAGLTGALLIAATAADNVAVAGVRFQVDGEDLGGEDTSVPYEVTLPATAKYASGQHVIRAQARDAAGNLSPWAVATVEFGGSVDLPAGFTRTAFVPVLPSLGTTMAFAPDGRLFICLQNGAVLIVKNGALLPMPFVTVATSATGERGLLGIAFHPDFGSNGWVYLYYTSAQGGTHNRISRFTAAGDTAETGETILVDLPGLSATNHNGGALHFGPDDKLYVAVGDNAVGANAQSLATVLGKILRFNDDGSIPTDNPFHSMTSGLNRSIWAMGLRNPYTFGFQSTGRMLINDVGEVTWEEINEGIPGANYGWPATEGPTSDPAFRAPVFAYRHGSGFVQGIAIVGSAFYQPLTANFPSHYLGQYFFADYAAGWIHRLDPGAGNQVSRFASIPGLQTDLRVGPDGALYTLARIANTWGVQRISFGP